MATDMRIKEQLPELALKLVHSYTEIEGINHLGHSSLPNRDTIVEIIEDLKEVIYPGYGRRQNLHLGNIEYHVGNLVCSLHDKLTDQIARALRHEHYLGADDDTESVGQQRAVQFLNQLPEIRSLLATDVRAAMQGDPAARSLDEIVFCYPGIEAITVHRIAHELHRLGVPLIPRIMAEWAHSKTGVDIHPGASIGRSFFIDHGTGVVIGETTNIGNRVKIYQGVTLGALSFPRDADGNIIRGMKRHPTIEDDVVIYVNATVLGGDTVVGQRSVVGSNVWLTESIPPFTAVTMEKPRLQFRGKSRPATRKIA